MSHLAQRFFCRDVKRQYPQHFKRVNVIDVGSMDINGNNKYLFSKSHYVGIDLHDGKNVDIIGRAHEVLPSLVPSIDNGVVWSEENGRIENSKKFDTIISTECLEHDCYIILTLETMYNKLKAGGLMLITCGGDGRQEHGTHRDRPELSPFTNDYYANVTNRVFAGILPPGFFETYHLAQVANDLQFYGIKKS